MLKKLILAIACVLTVLFAIPVAFNTYMPFYIIESGSMLPVYRIGSVVLVHNYPPRDIQDLIGNSVVFFDYPSGQVIVHRVIAVDGTYLVTKGDNNPTADAFKPALRDVLGIVWGHIP